MSSFDNVMSDSFYAYKTYWKRNRIKLPIPKWRDQKEERKEGKKEGRIEGRKEGRKDGKKVRSVGWSQARSELHMEQSLDREVLF